MNEDVECFGARLKAVCTEHREDFNAKLSSRHRAKAASINVAALAHLTGLDRNHVSDYLKGARLPTENELELIMRAFEVPEPEADSLRAQRARLNEIEISSATGTPFPLRVPDDDGLFEFNRWSPARRLTRDSHELRFHDPAVEDDGQGVVAVVSAVSDVDWRDTADSSIYRIELTSATYSDTVAFRSRVRSRRELRDAIAAAASEGDRGSLIKLAPSAKVSANVSVVSVDGQLLALKRSAVVQSHRNEWNVGVNETLSVIEGHLTDATLHDLALRGLLEEVGLRSDEVADLEIMWFGFCLDCVDWVVFARARTFLEGQTVLDRRATSFSSVEHSSQTLVRMSYDFLRRLASGQMETPDGTGAWLHHSPLAAELLWTNRTRS